MRLCADKVLERAESAKTRADNVCHTCRFSVLAPMRIRGITPAYLQATLDGLSRNALYTKKLQLERFHLKRVSLQHQILSMLQEEPPNLQKKVTPSRRLWDTQSM